MSWLRKHTWWELYLLAPLSAGLLYLDGRIHANLKVHELLAIAVVVVLCGLALLWTERHSDIVESEGIDARSPVDFYRMSGTFIAGSTVFVVPVGRPGRGTQVSARQQEQADYLPGERQPAIAKTDMILN